MTLGFTLKKDVGTVNGYSATQFSQIDKNGKVVKRDTYIDFNNDGINDLKVFQQGDQTSVFTAAARDGKSSWDEAPSEYDIYKEATFEQTTQKPTSDTKTSTPVETPTKKQEEGKTQTQQTVHTVAKGETLWNIAKKYGCTVEALADENDIKNTDKINIGQTLKIPTSKKTETQQSEVKSGNQEDFLDAIAFSESSGRYNAKNGQYLGKYQLGKLALQDIGYMDKNGNFTAKSGVKNAQEFLNSPEAQEKAMELYSKKQWGYIKKTAEKYEGETINGIPITISGMLAAAHLVGPSALKKYLTSGGKVVPKDGNGTSIETYLQKFAHYDVSGFTGNVQIAKN